MSTSVRNQLGVASQNASSETTGEGCYDKALLSFCRHLWSAAAAGMSPIDQLSISSCSTPVFRRAYAPVSTPAGVLALQRLRTFLTWSDNWDAEGAPAPDPKAIEAAQQILGFIQSYSVQLSTMLDANGHPMFFLRFPGGEGEININGDHLIDFAITLPNAETEAETDLEVSSEGLPPALTAVMQRLRTPA